jgi:hypothetical protein
VVFSLKDFSQVSSSIPVEQYVLESEESNLLEYRSIEHMSLFGALGKMEAKLGGYKLRAR